MAQLVRLRDRYNQPKRPSPLPSPPPTPGGDHKPTSLFRRPDLILLPDGRRISIYEDRHGVLVTDVLRWSTRPVEDVYMEVLYDLQTSPRDPPPPIAEPARRRHRGRDAHQPPIRCILPDKRIIHAYNDRHGVLVTDMDGSTRRVEDVCREIISDLPRDCPPPPMAKPVRRHHLGRRHNLSRRHHPGGDPHKPLLLLCLLPDDRIIHVYNDMYGFLVTKDMNGLTRPVQDVFREVLYDLWTRPRDPPPPVVDAAKEDQPAPQQTTTPSPDPSRLQFVDDLLNRACDAHKLKLAQRREDREQNVLASKELLGTTTLEESSITNASSMLQPTPREDREPTVLASKELLDTTTLESTTNASCPPQPTLGEDREPNILASKELLDTTTLESTTNASSPPQPTPFQPDMCSSKELLIFKETLGKSSIMDASSTRAEAVTHSLTPPILARKPAGWNHQFFIRVDLCGVFHTYPELGGPFRSLEEAKKAILLRLDELRDRKMRTNDGLSSSEIALRDALHWPDGTRKYSSRSNPDEDHMGLLVQALLDKYNEENNLLGDDAYHVEDVVSFQEVYEGKGGWYYHLNCTIKTKGGVDNLFFVEVLRMNRGLQFELTCLHMVKPAVDNGPCYGCKKSDVGMKHPIDAGKYKGGHDPLRPPRLSVVFPPDLPEGFDAKMKAMEERIRYLFQDPDVVKSDAGRTAAADGLDKSQLGRRGFPAADARMNQERIRYIYREHDVAKSDAGRTAAGLEGKRGKYVIPPMRLKV